MTIYVDLNGSFNSSNNIRDALKTNLQIANLRNDSIVNVMANAVGQELNKVSVAMKDVYERNNYLSAKGSDLDAIAYNLFGMRRNPAIYASSNETDYNIVIYLSPYSNYTNFQLANGNKSITIPKGTILTDSISTTGELGRIQYSLDKDYILTNQSKIYVSATAITYGNTQNINKNVIKRINFTNYEDSFNNSIIAGNVHPILSGRDFESDESFRKRIQMFLTSKTSNNFNDIQLNGMNIPGVITTEIIPGYYGIGTTGVIIFGPNRLATDKEVTALQEQIDNKFSNISKIKVSKGFFVNLDLEININIKGNISDTDQLSIRRELKNIVNNYILMNYNSNTISLDSIQSEIVYLFRNNSKIELQFKNGSIFNKKYIRRSSTLLGLNNSGFEVPDNNIVVNRDERLLINDVSINFEYTNYGV